jgi:hypothetical protein
MIKTLIPFLAFLILLLLTIPFSLDFSTSVVPGWHTTIYPPYFIWGLALMVILLLVTIGYWLLSKRVDNINWTLFAIQLILTIPTVIFLKFPSILLSVQETNLNELTKAVALRIKLIPVAWVLFIAGQVLFLVYYVRATKINRVER